MTKVALHPYLFFKGDCRQAIEFYKSIFGGELSMQTYAESGTKIEGMSPDHIMHVSLDTPDFTIMASDTTEASPQSAKVTLSLVGDDEKRLTKAFDALCDGATNVVPLRKEFWGDTFGTLTDKFGVDWMVDIAPPQAEETAQ